MENIPSALSKEQKKNFSSPWIFFFLLFSTNNNADAFITINWTRCSLRLTWWWWYYFFIILCALCMYIITPIINNIKIMFLERLSWDRWILSSSCRREICCQKQLKVVQIRRNSSETFHHSINLPESEKNDSIQRKSVEVKCLVVKKKWNVD